MLDDVHAVKRNTMAWATRSWSWLQRTVVGYGYQPTRTIAWFMVFLTAGSLYFSLRPTPMLMNPDDNLVWSPVSYTTDILVPIVNLGHDSRWHMVGADGWVAAALSMTGWIMLLTVAAALTHRLRR